jgi:hypothetical protein
MRLSIFLRTALVLSLALVIGRSQSTLANPAVYEVGSDPAVGFNLISWWNFGGSGVSTWQNAVQSVYDAGFRSVSIGPVRFVNINTGQILATSPRGPELSHIEAGVARAKSLGMRVTLNPFVELFDANGAGTGDDEYFADISGCGTWRACWNPVPGSAASNQFWADYQTYLTGVAQIAAAYNVDAMTVGTENNKLAENSGNSSSWNTVINAVDGTYAGPLGYAANWDDYRHTNVTTSIWENSKIDFIGIDSYFNTVLHDYYKYLNPTLTNSQISTLVNNATTPIQSYPDQSFIDLMAAAWNKFLDIDSAQVTVSDGTTRTYFAYDGILPFAAARKGGTGMPVAFTEQGYLYFNTSSASPQTNSGSVDTAEQRMAFQGLINALDQRGSVFNAMDIWQWWMDGSSGSQWNIDTTPPLDQPNNQPLALMLQSFIGTAVLPLAGDYNRDNAVNAADYVQWRKTLGKYVLQYSGADGNGNGIIDQPDYTVWRSNFSGAPGGAGMAGAVPEPATVWLFLMAIPCLVFARDDGRLVYNQWSVIRPT